LRNLSEPACSASSILPGSARVTCKLDFELPGLRLATDKPEARSAYTRMLTERIDLDAVRRLASTMAARQIWSCPTNVVYQGFGQRRADVLSDPDLKYVLEPTARRWAPRNEVFAGWSEERRSQVRAVFQANAELHVKLTGILHAEGAPILLATDTPNPFACCGKRFWRSFGGPYPNRAFWAPAVISWVLDASRELTALLVRKSQELARFLDRGVRCRHFEQQRVVIPCLGKLSAHRGPVDEPFAWNHVVHIVADPIRQLDGDQPVPKLCQQVHRVWATDLIVRRVVAKPEPLLIERFEG
jgi:hypothetical protein